MTAWRLASARIPDTTEYGAGSVLDFRLELPRRARSPLRPRRSGPVSVPRERSRRRALLPFVVEAVNESAAADNGQVAVMGEEMHLPGKPGAKANIAK
jgi:hypothetical protein